MALGLDDFDGGKFGFAPIKIITPATYTDTGTTGTLIVKSTFKTYKNQFLRQEEEGRRGQYSPMPSSLVWKEGKSEMKAARPLFFSLIVFASFLYF
jgi:hypothetical protein